MTQPIDIYYPYGHSLIFYFIIVMKWYFFCLKQLIKLIVSIRKPDFILLKDVDKSNKHDCMPGFLLSNDLRRCLTLNLLSIIKSGDGRHLYHPSSVCSEGSQNNFYWRNK